MALAMGQNAQIEPVPAGAPYVDANGPQRGAAQPSGIRMRPELLLQRSHRGHVVLPIQLELRPHRVSMAKSRPDESIGPGAEVPKRRDALEDQDVSRVDVLSPALIVERP